jgi:hypothetical protein
MAFLAVSTLKQVIGSFVVDDSFALRIKVECTTSPQCDIRKVN